MKKPITFTVPVEEKKIGIGLRVLWDRMDGTRSRPNTAFVALRTVLSAVRALPEGNHTTVRLSRDAAVALAEELTNIAALSTLRSILIANIPPEEETHEDQRTERHCRASVRESRDFRFQC